MPPEEQSGFDPRLAWGVEGGAVLARVCPVLVVVDVLGGRPSPEAGAAVAGYLDAAGELVGHPCRVRLRPRAGRRGHAADLALAAAADVSQVVPVLCDGAFGQLSWPG